MNVSRSMTARLAVFAALVMLGTSSLRAQVLQQVPSDALVVIKVSNLKATSDKIAKWAEAVGLTAMSPEFADPLKAMQDELELKEGLDTAGEMAFVFAKPASEGADPDESMLILMPVSDYNAFVTNFDEAKAEGDITTAKPKKGGQELNIANWGKYAAVAQNKALLAKKPAGLKLTGLSAKESKEKDAFIFANIPELRTMALPHIEEARTKAMGEIDKELGKDEDAKQFAGVAKAAFGQVLNIAEGFLNDATAASLSLHLNDKGLMLTALADFKPESYAGKIATKVKNTDQPMAAGLPNRKYFAFGGFVNEPEIAKQVLGDLLDPISKELAATEAGKGFAGAIESMKKALGATKSMAFGYPVPTGALGADSIIQSIVIAKGDAKVIAESQKASLQGMADLMKLMPKEGGQMTYELTPGGKTVGDVKLDAYTFNLTLDENNPQAAQAQQMMAFIYGPNGMGGTFGAVNKDTFLMIQGGTDKLLNEAVKAAQDPKDTLSGGVAVKKIAGQLPAKHAAVQYIFLDNIVTSAVKYAQGFGMQVKMSLPADLPPIGVSAATDGPSVRIDGFVPTDLVQNLVSAGMQTFMEMQGGGAAEKGGADGL
jgi:hypothetical protein